MNVGSLFSGIGGIELGFEREGFKTIWFVENDAYCQAVLRKRFPNTEVYGDITTLDFTAVQRPDVLTGGFPCQDISNAGRRAGITGSRSSLWKHYLRAIGELRPGYAVIENVSALTQRGLDVVLADLAQVGYDAEWYNLSASAAGAPHRRERIFIISYPDGGGRAPLVNAGGGREADCGGEGHVEPGGPVKDVADGSGGGLEEQGQGQELQSSEGSEAEDVAHPECGRCGKGRESGELASVCRGRTNNASEIKESSDVAYSDEFGDWPAVGLQKEGGGEAEHSGAESPRPSHDATNTHWDELEESPGEKSEGSIAERGWWSVEPDVGRVAHGVPSRVDRIKCLGNAVVPQVAQVIARAIREYGEAEENG